LERHEQDIIIPDGMVIGILAFVVRKLVLDRRLMVEG